MPRLRFEDVLALRVQALREKCRRSFEFFFRLFWSAADPATLVWGKHLHAICLHLQAVADGKIRKLIVNIPPRHSKTQALVLFLAWRFARDPTFKVMYCSYVERLATTATTIVRRVMTNPLYRELFPHVEFSEDQDTKSYVRTTGGGEMLALSAGAKMSTGFGCDLQVADDPSSAANISSDEARQKVTEWWDGAMSTRHNVPTKGERIIVMQRLAEDDLSGHCIAKGDYTHLCLPAEFDPEERCETEIVDYETGDTWRDWRTEKGELLCPERFPRSAVEELRASLKDDAEGQLNQKPAPPGGFIFDPTWWRRHSRDPDSLQSLTISVDSSFVDEKASKSKKGPDWFVATLWGAMGADRFGIARERGRWGLADGLDAVRRLLAKYPRTVRVLVERAANGFAIVEMLTRELRGVEVVGVTPLGSKVARAMAVQHQVRDGHVYLPCEPWADELIDEAKKFPRGKHDDQVDSMTQALNVMQLSTEAYSAWVMFNAEKLRQESVARDKAAADEKTRREQSELAEAVARQAEERAAAERARTPEQVARLNELRGAMGLDPLPAP